MAKAIVTVKRVEEARVRDLELPVDVPSAQLAEMVAKALGWDMDATGYPVSYNIEAHPPGRLLNSGETLAQAGAWDGSWLVFHPRGAIHASVPGSSVVNPVTAPKAPIPPAFTTPVAPADPPPAASGFVWKRIDED